ncbi:MAG: ABC transporter ATP-binding protein [Anaerolineae bacterium]
MRPRQGAAGRRPDTQQTPDVPIRMGRLLGYLRPHAWRIGVALVCVIITTGIGLVFPIVIQNLIDSVLVENDLQLLNRIALGLVVLFVVRFGFAYVQRFMLEYAGERIVIDIREQVYNKLMDLPVQFFTERRTGEIVSRLASDATLVRTALTNNVAFVLGQALTLVGAIVIVLFINARMTLFVLALAPPIGLLAAFFGRAVRNISTEVQDEIAGSSVIVEEVVSAVRIVKTFVREQFEVQRYRDKMERTFRAALKLTRVRSAFGQLIFNQLFQAIVGVLWFGGREVVAGRLTAGGLTSFLFYLIFIAGSFGAFTGIYTQLQEATGAMRRIFEILDTKPDIVDRPDAITLTDVEGRITFDGVSFSYDDRVTVLNNIDLDIRPGEIVALVGPSGAGKSTLVSLIPRFYDPTEGRVLIDGVDLRDATQNSIREHMALVPQETLLFGGTIRENIQYGKLDATDEELVTAAVAANAHSFIEELIDGYDTIVGENGGKLSGGQRQRISIARAILADPTILLLDEATSSLDSESEGLVQEALERLLQGRTTVIIAHRLSTVQVADRIAVMDRGRIVELGTHADLLTREEGLYNRLYTLQFQAGIDLSMD